MARAGRGLKEVIREQRGSGISVSASVSVSVSETPRMDANGKSRTSTAKYSGLGVAFSACLRDFSQRSLFTSDWH